MIGTRLAQYEILAKLAQGGMGVVYRARDTRLDREVVIKMLPQSLSRDPSRLARFEQEAKAVAALSHPNILTIHDFGQHQGTPYAVMELLKGRTLREVIRAGECTAAQTADVGVQLARGLAAAHECGILHRDLKPENVFLTQDGGVKILDFGLAWKGPAPRTSGVVGTPGYMAPEQARGLRVDGRADLFSLGCVLYEMLAGGPPFPGETDEERMRAALEEEPVPLNRAAPNLPPDLIRAVERCMKKKLSERVRSARDVESSLRAVAKQVDGPAEAEGSTRKGIVVLPFKNLGSQEENFFADGMTEEITSRLATVKDLCVISRASAVLYADSQKSLREIGRDLNVGYVLEGAVRWDQKGNRVRITPRLIRVSDETHLWSEQYDRVLDDVFAVQSEIAERVVQHLEANLREGDHQLLAKRPTENLEAYHAFLRGLSHTSESTLTYEEMLLAIRMFERAVELDPNFVEAQTRLALDHSSLIIFGFDTTPERWALAKAAADRVTAMDPGSYYAHVAQGFYAYRCDKDLNRALYEFGEAQKQRPNDARLPACLSYIQRRQGDWQKSLANLKMSVAADPQNAVRVGQLGISLTFLRQYAEADQAFSRSISLAPDQQDSYLEWVKCLWLWQGSVDRASEVLSRAPLQEHPRVQLLWTLNEVLGRNWDKAYERVTSSPVELYLDQDEWYPKPLLEFWCLNRMQERRKAADRAQAAAVILEEARKENPEDPRILGALGLLYADLGRGLEALDAGESAVQLVPEAKDAIVGTILNTNLAKIHAKLGNRSGALERIEHLLSVPAKLSPAMLRLDPDWDNLREDPQFENQAA